MDKYRHRTPQLKSALYGYSLMRVKWALNVTTCHTRTGIMYTFIDWIETITYKYLDLISSLRWATMTRTVSKKQTESQFPDKVCLSAYTKRELCKVKVHDVLLIKEWLCVILCRLFDHLKFKKFSRQLTYKLVFFASERRIQTRSCFY